MSQSGNIKSNNFGPININFEENHNFDSHMDKFDPSQFFIPGWKGEGLISSNGLLIKSILNNLTIDATSLFKKLSTSTVSMKKQTYEEFMSYARFNKLDLEAFSTPNDFWFHFQDDSSPFQVYIQEYIRLFCFRAVAIYLFRIKFILDLSSELKLELTDDTLFNPLSFLSRIFRKNSSTELVCESLQINQYSWYRPTQEYKDSIIKMKEAFKNVTITELIKLLSTPKEYKIYSVKNYSHSLSHQSFGLFINELVMKFPKWISSEEKVSNPLFENKSCILPKTISTNFEGQHASSFALSHWLAQEANLNDGQWDNIICPSFEGTEFIEGNFLKICHELQFLSFLVKVATIQGYEVVPFICKIIKDRNSASAEDSFDQISLLDLAEGKSHSKFNRIVLNILDLPKNNPHHHLVTQIQNKKSAMKKDGMIFVLTNQKLFVPSHSDRVEQLLKDFKLHATFIFDELKGRGEVPQYIYVFSLRESQAKMAPYLFKVNRNEKESCKTFQLKGNLARFNKFNLFVQELKTFFKNKKTNSTPIFVNEIDTDLTFEFHVDAIIEGKLVSSTANKEMGQMAHPSYFKNLTSKTISLDSFFHMDIINPNDSQMEKSIASELLGAKSGFKGHYPLLLIVNQSNPLHVQLELVPFESFKAKVEENGTAFFTYFGLTPKHTSINLNVFREYFNSKIGFQIIQMQLTDGQAKLKGKLKSLLVPAFLARTNFMPDEYLRRINLLEKDANELMKFDPSEIQSSFDSIEVELENLITQYPWHTLGLLSHFKLNLTNSLSDIDSNKMDNVLFANPLIAKELIKLPTLAIYPKHNDVYVNIETQTPSDLQKPLTSSVIKNDEENFQLILFSGDKKVISIYSNENMINFMKFIIQNAEGAKIADIIMGLRVPSISDLESVIAKFSGLKECKIELIKKADNMIARIFQNQILN